MPSETSDTNATTGLTVQLSASSVTTVISGTGTSPVHCTVTGAGLLAVGLVVSSMLIVCVAVLKLPHASVTLYVLVITIGHVPALLSTARYHK